MLMKLVLVSSLLVSLGWSVSACSEVYYEHCR
jgi:predicted type IV restriction endonuclease